VTTEPPFALSKLFGRFPIQARYLSTVIALPQVFERVFVLSHFIVREGMALCRHNHE